MIADRARLHGLVLNFGPGKTEAILVLRVPGAKAMRQEVEAVGGALTELFAMRVVGAYKRLGNMVTSTACPTQDAATRVSQATGAYARVSGSFAFQ